MSIRPFLLSLITVIAVACGGSDTAPGGNSAAQVSGNPKQITSIQWIDSVKNYGKIIEGQKLAVSFRFKNSGDKPLIIESVRPSCGCTVADYTREPVAPGAEGMITGEFDSDGREGLQHKELTVRSNTQQGEHNIFFEVNVIGKAKDNNPDQPFK